MHLRTIHFIGNYKRIITIASIVIVCVTLTIEFALGITLAQGIYLKEITSLIITLMLIPPLIAMIRGLASNKDEARETILKIAEEREDSDFKRAYMAKMLRKLYAGRTIGMSIIAAITLAITVVAFINNSWYTSTTPLALSICVITLTNLMEHIDYSSTLNKKVFLALCQKAVKEFADQKKCEEMEEALYNEFVRGKNEESN